MKPCMICRKQRKEMLDKEEQRKKALLEAKRAHEVTVALMQESLEKERARKESEEAESRQLLEKRVSAVLSLKKNIDAQRVSDYDAFTGVNCNVFHLEEMHTYVHTYVVPIYVRTYVHPYVIAYVYVRMYVLV